MIEWEPWLRPGEMEAFETFEQPDPSAGELDVADAERRQDVPYWVWHNNRLVPAPPDKVARIREIEALRRLDLWRRNEHLAQRAARSPIRRAGARARALWAVCRRAWRWDAPRQTPKRAPNARRARMVSPVED